MSDIDKAREAYKLWWDTSPAPVPTACTTYIGALEAELTSLRSQLEEARENALEEAAKWHEEQAREISEIAEQNAHHFILCDKLKLSAGAHRQHAAAIRKLKGVTKPKPVPSLGKLFDDLATKQRLIGEEFEKFMADIEDTTEADDEGAIRKLKEGR